MDKKVVDIINEQINKEFYSAYLYLDMANYYSDNALDGFANYYEKQAEEELEHGMAMYHYLLDNDEKVVLEAIAKPDKTYASFIEPVKAALAHEQYVTASIVNCRQVAVDAGDMRTMIFMNGFVTEQGEEEDNARDLLDKMELYGDDRSALYLLDKELSKRD